MNEELKKLSLGLLNWPHTYYDKPITMKRLMVFKQIIQDVYGIKVKQVKSSYELVNLINPITVHIMKDEINTEAEIKHFKEDLKRLLQYIPDKKYDNPIMEAHRLITTFEN